ncbi:MAG: MYXO-CTERM sorting domain-containing protein [Polyangiaceae bacterium]
MRSRLLAFARSLAVLFALALVLTPAVARAAGSVQITDLQPKENDERWKLKMTINYGSVPPLAHVPMLFSFTPTVLYERALTDQSPKTPTINKIPLSNQQSINESMDVGFSDASGKIFNITKFDFVIRRDHGFEAGEYQLKITRSSDGAQMGQTFRIILQGDNPIVDRRAIVFSGEKKEKKPDPAASDTEKKDDAPPSDMPPSDPDPSAQSDTPVETPPTAPPKQGGCGCRVSDAEDHGSLVLVPLLGLVAIGWRRRRRRKGGSTPRAARVS